MNSSYLLISQAEYSSFLHDLTALQCRISTLASRVVRFDLPNPNPFLPGAYINNAMDQHEEYLRANRAYYQGWGGMYRGYRDSLSDERYAPRRCKGYRMYPTTYGYPSKDEPFVMGDQPRKMFDTELINREEGGGTFGANWRDSRRSEESSIHGIYRDLAGMGGIEGVEDMVDTPPMKYKGQMGGMGPLGRDEGGEGYFDSTDMRSLSQPSVPRTGKPSTPQRLGFCERGSMGGSWTPPIRGGPHSTPNVTRAAPVESVPRGQKGGRLRGGRRVRPVRQATKAENVTQDEVVDYEDEEVVSFSGP
jgi:hypothetical protein